MTLRHFQIFLYVHDEGGMTRAAEKLHISQPSVSQTIRELEEHYGTRLIPRTISDLSQFPFITREVGSGTRELFTRIMAEQGIKPEIIGTYNNSESIKQAVMAGFGIAVLSKRVAHRELAAGSLIQFDIPGISFTRTFRIVCHVNKSLTPAMENFIDLCGEWDTDS